MSTSEDKTDHWAALEAHFHAALALPSSEREAYLQAHCPDPELRREVEKLIAAGDDFKTGVATLIERASSGAAAGIEPGSRIGAYRVLRPIAEGGMGAVYLAERADGQFQQQVALKLLRSPLPGAELTSRFRHERQILAGLRHPNIATLFDGGATEQGLPYLVMEYVEGERIDRHCQAQGLPLEDRLRLMQKLCAAVQTAHQSLIVHRDIKPGNILVDASGEPKLLDFGIAKLLDDEGGAAAPETQYGQRMLTPEYASPEQIRGEAVGTASDVYSLGVVLYQLLTGQSPYARWRTRPLELQQAICETDPPRPSETSPAGEEPGLPDAALLRRELRGDLDHIVLKALRKEPGARYSSPAALAEDLQRFLDRQPISAREGSWRYVLGKFLRRNALGVGVAAAVLLTISALVGFYTQRLQAERDVAEKERQAAESERQAAEKATDFMVSIFSAANADQQRPDVLAADLLAGGAQRLEEELADQPLIEARLQQAIGKAYLSLHLTAEGEARVRRALELMRTHAPEDELAIAALQNELGIELTQRERYDDALALLEDSLAIYGRVLGESDRRVADLLMDIDRVVSQRDRSPTPARWERFQRALRIYRNAGMGLSREVAVTHSSISAWHKQRFEWAESRANIREAMRIREAMGIGEHVSTAFTIEDAARLEYFAGDYAAARPLFERTIGILESFKGPDTVDMTWSTYYLARLERESGHAGRARELMARTVAIETATPLTADRRYEARALCGLALIRADAGELAQAQVDCERGREILLATLGDQDRVQMDVIHEGLGVVALALGDVDTALAEFDAMVALLRLERDPAQTDTPRAIGMLASARAAAGDLAGAEALLAEALALAAERYPADYPTLGRLHWARALLREQAGQPATVDRERAQSIFQRRGIVPQQADWTMAAR